jgi:hypothetical protein
MEKWAFSGPKDLTEEVLRPIGAIRGLGAASVGVYDRVILVDGWVFFCFYDNFGFFVDNFGKK